MDKTLERNNGSIFNIGSKVVGDLGDIEVTENSDCEDDKVSVKKIVSRTNNNNSTIPSNLIQNTVPVFGKVTVANSENVQFGNNTYFNGPVTVKQIIHSKSGVDNAGYTNTEEEGNGRDTQHSQRGKHKGSLLKKEAILLWHKITLAAVCVTIIGSIIAVVVVLQNKNEPPKKSHPHIDLEASESPTESTVQGYCNDNFLIIFTLVILLPLTFTIFYSLLTKENIGNGKVHVVSKNTKDNVVHENCLNKFCKQCKEGDPILISPNHLRIVSRSDWLAQPVEKPVTKLKLPAPWVVITHTATESCHTQSICVLRVRVIQSFHIESRGWSDIGYNWLVGGDGSVYYGRGWDYEGAHTKGYNKYSIGIAFIGTFNTESPPRQQIEACQKIINRGVELGKIAQDYKLFAHRQLMSTLSPGDELYNIIKTWPHFVTNLNDTSSLLPNTS